jgi:hypothetical protein
LEAIRQVGKPEVGDIGFGVFTALSGPLRHVAWPPRFRLDMLACFDKLPTPSSSCSATQSTFGWPEATGTLWTTNS